MSTTERAVLLVAGASEARDYVLRGPPITGLVSIRDTTRQDPWPWTTRIEERLELMFDDVVRPWQGYVPAELPQVQQLVDFARQVRAAADPTGATPSTVLVHCHAGASRSAAAALVMHAAMISDGLARLYDGEDASCRLLAAGALNALLTDLGVARRLGLRDDVSIRPNPWVVVLGDHLLTLGGALAEIAVRAWPDQREDYRIAREVLAAQLGGYTLIVMGDAR